MYAHIGGFNWSYEQNTLQNVYSLKKKLPLHTLYLSTPSCWILTAIVINDYSCH